jgi:uncharacterized protein (DUF1501 family)
MMSISRRAFLRHAAAMSTLGAAAPLGLNLSAIGKASAQNAQGNYKALVCVFLYGGNDAYNTVLCNDSTSWSAYTHQRDPNSSGLGNAGTSLALMTLGTPAQSNAAAGSPEKLGGVLPINISGTGANSGRSLALHPLLTDVASMHQAGRIAVLANVGPLVEPLSKAQYAGTVAARPAKLFSHNDQQSTWQSFSPEGADAGWGGRMGDLLMSRNGTALGGLTPLIQQSLTCISPGTPSVWLTGNDTRSLQVGLSAIPSIAQAATQLGHAPLQNALDTMMRSGGTNLFATDHQEIVGRAVQTQGLLGSLLPSLDDPASSAWATPTQSAQWLDPMLQYTSPMDDALHPNPLAQQLQMVARLIDANRRGQLGIERQVFMVSLGGFDTHANQNLDHADRMAQLNHALAYFDAVLGRMPAGDMRSQVTTFTASDFGRSLTNNGDGTDHGWGGHHFIMGGAVQGGDVYGLLPQYATADAQGMFASPDLIDNGIMLPSTSVDQYAYTLGRWMDVSNTDLLGILPHLGNFNVGTHNLGFMA